ncbi:MAG TPA: tetratricopeptide repeat protein [Streptosporangiaceae bacterium]
MSDPPDRADRGPGRPRAGPPAGEADGSGLEPAVAPTPSDRGWGPAALLRPEREVVAFAGRTAERSSLRDWCAGLAPHSVRLIVGAPGVGKTRLVRQLAADWAAQAEPWRMVEPGDEPHAAAAARTVGPGRPLLIVDDAESRNGLAPLLEATLTGPGEARVLLVARSLGDWWGLLVEGCPPAVARLLTEAPPVRLDGPLDAGLTDAEVAAAAVPHFAAAMSLQAQGRLEIERSALRLPVLLLHAAALLAVLRSAADGQAPVRVVVGPRVLDELLEHELRYWQSSAAAAGLDYHPEPVTHAVTMATLAGPWSVAEAEAAVARVPYLTGEPPDGRVEWARWLAGLYPPGPNGRAGGLRPDLLAQTLVVRQLAGDPVLARRFIRALPSEQAAHAVALLAWATVDDPAAIGLLREALEYDLAGLAAPAALVAQQVPGVLPGLLRDALGSAPAAPDALAAIVRGLPAPSPAVAEPELIAILRAREALAAGGPAGLAEWDDRAVDVLGWLDGHDLPGAEPGHAGGVPGWLADPRGTGPPALERPGEAQFGARRAAASLARERQAELASALTDLAVRCSDRDRAQDARRAEQQAVRIYRDLAASEPDRYRPELAVSLANLGVWQATESGPADAVPPTVEAAGILRDLADDDPGQYRPELVTCLANLGVWHTRAGQPGEAVSAELETASILRGLAAADPGQYQAELAAALTNLGISYSRAGRATEALPVEQEAVSIRWELAAADPGRYRADLASSLTNLAITQAELGDLDEAADAAQDAVTVYRDLAVVDPARYRRDLARALANLGIRHRELGRPETAAEALGEAVSIRRGLAATDPDRNLAGLARSLASVAAALADLGRYDDADAARAEARALTAGPGAPSTTEPAAASITEPSGSPVPQTGPAPLPDLGTAPLAGLGTASLADLGNAPLTELGTVPEPETAPPLPADASQPAAAAPDQPPADKPARRPAATAARQRGGKTGQPQSSKPGRTTSGKRRQPASAEQRQPTSGERRESAPGERRQPASAEQRQPTTGTHRRSSSGTRRKASSGAPAKAPAGAAPEVPSGAPAMQLPAAEPDPVTTRQPAEPPAEAGQQPAAEPARVPAQRRKPERTRQRGRTPTAGS